MTDAASAQIATAMRHVPALLASYKPSQAAFLFFFFSVSFLMSGIGLGCATSLGLRAPPCGRTHHTTLTKTDAGASAVLHTQYCSRLGLLQSATATRGPVPRVGLCADRHVLTRALP